VLTRPTSNAWFVGFGLMFLLTMVLLFSVAYLFVQGIGIWGVNIPIGWGFAIVNFVWWIGIGHAGTLIPPSCCYCGNRGATRSTVSPRP
jgi:molybdopterin-containing oxidoreductase family membrane subunit